MVPDAVEATVQDISVIIRTADATVWAAASKGKLKGIVKALHLSIRTKLGDKGL
jgi:hypothetical protein